MSTPSRKRIVLPKNRQSVTGEPDPGGRYTPAFPDSIGYGSQGGGNVPADLVWRSSPKQRQEEMTEANLAKRRLTAQAADMGRVLAAQRAPAALPAGTPAAAPAGAPAAPAKG